MADEKDVGQEDLLNESNDQIDTSPDTGVSSDGQLGTDEPIKKLSIRDSIKEAIKEETRSPEERDLERDKNLEKAREARKAKRAERSASEVDTNTNVIAKSAKIAKESVGKDVSTPKADSQPPNGWTKEAKADWLGASEAIKQSVAKREKEVSDGFKTYGEIKKRHDELEAVIAPRRNAIQRWGVSEAQTVDRLFQWMESLTGPNKINSWLALGQNFGINLNDVVRTQGSQAGTAPAVRQQSPQQPPANQVPDAVRNYVESAVGQVSNYLTNQRQEAANNYLANWAKDKPHFEQVRRTMYGLIDSGAVPIVGDNVDLDTAYEWACNAHPEIRTAVQADAQEKAAAKAADDAQRAEAARIVKLNKARAASSSLRPTAPTPVASRVPGNTGKTQTARDSIRAAITELVGQ